MGTRERWAGVVAGVALAGFLLLALAAHEAGPFMGEAGAIRAAQVGGWRWLARFFEGTVDDWIIPGVTVAAVVALAWRREWGWALAFALLFAARPVNAAAKEIVGRPRPAGDFEVHSFPDTAAFPSGHAFNSAMLAGLALLFLFAKVESGSWRVAACAAVAVFVVVAGASRLNLGVHWPTDVLGAWLLALALLAGGWWLTRVTGRGK